MNSTDSVQVGLSFRGGTLGGGDLGGKGRCLGVVSIEELSRSLVREER